MKDAITYANEAGFFEFNVVGWRTEFERLIQAVRDDALAEPTVKESLTVQFSDHIADADKMVCEPVHEALQIASVALQDIACSSQTDSLLWWQTRAREAQKQIAECLTNAAPVEPVKQEPVFKARKAFWDAALGNNTKLANLAKAAIDEAEKYAAPVRTKDLTDGELTAIWERNAGDWLACFRAVIAADRKLNGVEK